MLGIASFLSLLATCASVLVFLSPLKEVQKSKEVGSTRGQSAVPFVCMWANCCLWCLYGLQVKVMVMLLVNGTGIFLSSYYIYVWVLLSKDTERTQLSLTILGALCFVLWATLYTIQWVGPFVETNILPWIAEVDLSDLARS